MNDKDFSKIESLIKNSENRIITALDKVTNNLMIELSRAILDPIYRSYTSLIGLYDKKSPEAKKLAENKDDIIRISKERTEKSIQKALDNYNLLIKSSIIELNDNTDVSEDVSKEALSSMNIEDVMDSINQNTKKNKNVKPKVKNPPKKTTKKKTIEPEEEIDEEMEPDYESEEEYQESDNDDEELDDDVPIRKTIDDDDDDLMSEDFLKDRTSADSLYPEGYDPQKDINNPNGDPL